MEKRNSNAEVKASIGKFFDKINPKQTFKQK